MKTIIVMLFSLFVLVGCSRVKVDSSDVPSVVITSFNQKYPDAQDIKWCAENDNGFYFKADFKVGVEEKSAQFKTDGTFVEEGK
jgi:hypothetical protein